MKPLAAFVRLCPAVCLSLSAVSQSPVVGTVTGTVFDPSGAAISGARLTLRGGGTERSSTADALGQFSFIAPPGLYELTADAPGFRSLTRTSLEIHPNHNPSLSLTLQIDAATEQVDVPVDQGLSTDAASSKGVLSFKGDQLEVFSDDPKAMQQQLQAISGSDPTNPPQLYVDGFSNGQMPPKESIREIRINQDPLSAQNDRFGFGRIDIFTKPGSGTIHGNVQFNYGNSSLNARNPYTGVQPPYSNRYAMGNINGPIGKKSSFFVSGQRADLSANGIVNAVILDSSLNPVTLSQAVSNPTVSQTYSGRFDRQFGLADTFIAKFLFTEDKQPNAGTGLLVLPEQGYRSDVQSQTLQLTDTHIFSPNIILDAGLQYTRTHTRQDPTSNAPSLIVQGSFTGGGNDTQALHDNLDHLELQQYLSIAHGKHFIRTGLRYRLARDANFANAGANGEFVFPDITTYRNTLIDLANHLSWDQIRAKGDGPTQFSLSAGRFSASLSTSDIGLYAADEWKVRTNLTLNYGLRLESQSAIPDHFDVAPRLGFAWSVKPSKSKEPVLVLRGGFGLFYERFPSASLLQSVRQNGTTEQVYKLTNPQFFPDFPSPSSLSGTPPTTYQVSPSLRSPTQMQGIITAEHSFGKLGSVAINYFQRRSVHEFTSLNVNAPDPSTGIRPLGGSQNLYQYSSAGTSDGHTFAMNGQINATKRLNVWAFFAAGSQKSNTAGISSFPTNSYNLRVDEGSYLGYTPRQLYSGINAQPGWGTSFNLFFSSRSHSNFNITTGSDNNNDSIYNDRPSFATDLSRPSVMRTAFGNFDLSPIAGQTIIPINYGRAPSFLYLELYANKDFHFGPRPAALTPPSSSAAAAGSGPAKKAELPPQKYRLQFGIGADNILNHTNPGTPVGVLTSPYFGRSISLNAPFTNNTAANRAVTLRTAFYF